MPDCLKIFAAALDYAPAQRLDGTPCTYVRLRVLVDGPTGFWTEDACASPHDYLEVNDIAVRDLVDLGDQTFIARIDSGATDLKGFVDWSPGVVAEGLTLRTFLNVLSPDDKSLFDEDDCWLTIKIGDRSLTSWYERLKSM